MIDLSRKYDRISGFTTLIVVALLFFVLLLSKCTVDAEAKEEFESGGVTVSLGEPDYGGPDNSAQEMEEYTPPEVEEYVPESQVTADDVEAPKVNNTQQTKPPTKTPPTETTKTPTETKKPPRKPNDRAMLGKKMGGKGSGSGDKAGQQGDPTGSPDGRPDGAGRGNGSSTGLGNGITQEGLGGFKVSKIKQPQGGIQDEGVVRLKVCVDASGNVIPSSIKYAPDRNPNTSTNTSLRSRAIAALKEFKFTNTTGSNGGCGYISFNFKLH